MNFLFDNPLANLPGTQFLMLYAALIAVSAMAFQIIKQQMDTTRALPLPPIPHQPDAYEIAYLRGGENELARAVIFALTQKGFLEVLTNEADKAAWVQRTTIAPDANSLNYLESKVYEYFAEPHLTREIFTANNLPEIIKSFGVTYAQRLENSNLLTGAAAQNRVAALKWFFMFSVLAFGGYKLFTALMNGYFNVGFLVLGGAAAIIMFALTNGLPRVSALGKKYLERLETLFEPFKRQIQFGNQPQNDLTPDYNAVNPALLAVGVFGVGALAGSSFDSYHQAFQRSQTATNSGSGCGSGCGSSWDSASSSGGDGGSSDGGGGGCGGCGGGCS